MSEGAWAQEEDSQKSVWKIKAFLNYLGALRCDPCAIPLEGIARSCRSQWPVNQQEADRAWGAVMGSAGRPGLCSPPPGNFSWMFQWGGVILIAEKTAEYLWVVQCITAMRHDSANWYIRAVCAEAGNRHQLTKFGLTGLGILSQAEALDETQRKRREK